MIEYMLKAGIMLAAIGVVMEIVAGWMWANDMQREGWEG